MQQLTFHFESRNDIVEMERVIRNKLKCHPQAPCKFLNSAPYVEIKMALIRWLEKLITHEVAMCAYTENGLLALRLHADTTPWVVTLVDTATVQQPTTEMLRKRKYEVAMVEEDE